MRTRIKLCSGFLRQSLVRAFLSALAGSGTCPPTMGGGGCFIAFRDRGPNREGAVFWCKTTLDHVAFMGRFVGRK